MIYIFILLYLFSAVLTGVCVYVYRRKVLNRISELEEKFKLNPSYETQLMLADLLSGKGLFKIERLDTENLFYFRK